MAGGGVAQPIVRGPGPWFLVLEKLSLESWQRAKRPLTVKYWQVSELLLKKKRRGSGNVSRGLRTISKVLLITKQKTCESLSQGKIAKEKPTKHLCSSKEKRVEVYVL